RHHFGPGGARPAYSHPNARQYVAGHRHDRVEQHRSGGGGDAPRRARLRPEALGKYPPARHFAHANRFAAGTEAGIASRSRKPHPERRIAADISGEIPCNGARPGLVGQIGPSEANVLITGEHGAGKEVVARTLHALSARATKPMVTVNAGGLSEGVFESELFGHVKGAYTDARTDRVGRFELADSSTLFLDEIANVPLNLQAKLLRV